MKWTEEITLMTRKGDGVVTIGVRLDDDKKVVGAQIRKDWRYGDPEPATPEDIVDAWSTTINRLPLDLRLRILSRIET